MSTGGLGDLFSEEKKKVRRVTLASASHLLPPTMSDSEIGGEPAIILIMISHWAWAVSSSGYPRACACFGSL